MPEFVPFTWVTFVMLSCSVFVSVPYIQFFDEDKRKIYTRCTLSNLRIFKLQKLSVKL